jgi:hypothetical protein
MERSILPSRTGVPFEDIPSHSAVDSYGSLMLFDVREPSAMAIEQSTHGNSKACNRQGGLFLFDVRKGSRSPPGVYARNGDQLECDTTVGTLCSG